MKVLVVHNAYRESGGEDAVVDQERRLLGARGHDVHVELFDNTEIATIASRVTVALRVGRNRASAERLKATLSAFGPDVVHVHNFFPLVTPGALDAIACAGVPIVQTLHNFRTICPGGLLMREGRACELCVGRHRWPAVRWRCYRNSAIGSAATAHMGYVFRRVVNRHRDLITLVALTQFARSRFLADGFDGDQMVVRPNFSSDLGPGLATRDGRLLYVGRLSDEKGADIVVKAAARVRATVEIVGDGPQAAHLRSIASPNVLFAGRISRAEVANKLRSASAALVPSRCYESFPMIVAEAMSCATPIIGSDLGALAELVDNRKTGRLVVPDSVDAWVQAMNEAVENPEQLAMWGLSGRRTYAARYDENHGYDSLVKIYQGAIAKASARQIRLQSPLAYGLAQSAGGYARQQQSHS